MSAEFYLRPAEKIKVVGITGTNGKTTISYLLEAILKEAGSSPAVIRTINYRFKDRVAPSKNTTPGPPELQSMLSDMCKQDVDYLIMEVSSHALEQGRAREIDFHSAIFTNLTQDHLDYHKSMANYFRSKARLFKDLKKEAFAVINVDDKYAKALMGLTKAKVVTYGLKDDVYVRAGDISFNTTKTDFLLCTKKIEERFSSRLIGRHNVYNLLAAIAWALEEEIELSVIKSAIQEFPSVPGRLERVGGGGGFSVFVDYAHTEDALKNVINTLRPISDKRIIVVFGCGGERDRNKRPKMGRVVSELADYAIITNDNPRSEDPQRIIRDIVRGIKKQNYCVETNRRLAIRKSLSWAKEGDIVLVAGKGHEGYQILKDRVLVFDDRQVVRECLGLKS